VDNCDGKCKNKKKEEEKAQQRLQLADDRLRLCSLHKAGLLDILMKLKWGEEV
jgi:hypothetical protein